MQRKKERESIPVAGKENEEKNKKERKKKKEKKGKKERKKRTEKRKKPGSKCSHEDHFSESLLIAFRVHALWARTAKNTD